MASSFAAYQLLDEYQKASAALQASVEELKLNTDKVSSMSGYIEVANSIVYYFRFLLMSDG